MGNFSPLQFINICIINQSHLINMDLAKREEKQLVDSNWDDSVRKPLPVIACSPSPLFFGATTRWDPDWGTWFYQSEAIFHSKQTVQHFWNSFLFDVGGSHLASGIYWRLERRHVARRFSRFVFPFSEQEHNCKRRRFWCVCISDGPVCCESQRAVV